MRGRLLAVLDAVIPLDRCLWYFGNCFLGSREEHAPDEEHEVARAHLLRRERIDFWIESRDEALRREGKTVVRMVFDRLRSGYQHVASGEVEKSGNRSFLDQVSRLSWRVKSFVIGSVVFLLVLISFSGSSPVCFVLYFHARLQG